MIQAPKLSIPSSSSNARRQLDKSLFKKEGRKILGCIRPARVPKENHVLPTQTGPVRKKFPEPILFFWDLAIAVLERLTGFIVCQSVLKKWATLRPALSV